MNLSPKPRIRRGLLLALAALLFFPLAATAQDRPDRGERLKQALDLTDAQIALVENAVGDEAERGDLWNVAAALTPTLTDAQKQKLFARPDRAQRDSEKTRGDRAEQREERSEEMQAALGLSDAQVQQLEALRAERQADRSELPDEVAAILTPQQQEIAKVHRALAGRTKHGGRRGGNRR